jgi:cell division protein FtsI/penicillin-binding protein 2
VRVAFASPLNLRTDLSRRLRDGVSLEQRRLAQSEYPNPDPVHLYNFSVLRNLAAIVVLLGTTVHAADLNTKLAQIMRSRSGAAVIVDVSSGRILADYHPEVAARRLARPGSACKTFTLLALLRSGKLHSTDSLVCRRHLHVGRLDLSCSHPQAGPLQAVSALAYSCNDFFATFGLRLTAEDLRAAFTQAGFASPSGLVPDEAVGSIHIAPSDEGRQLQAIGEGDMRVTPLEMLAAYRNLALRRTAADITDAERTVFTGLEESTGYGMARLASVAEMKVAGKTGTSRTDQGSWTNAWFSGYAPADEPQIAVVVFLERGTGPSDVAALGGEIFRAWLQDKQEGKP